MRIDLTNGRRAVDAVDPGNPIDLAKLTALFA